jgi:hypothetical protein
MNWTNNSLFNFVKKVLKELKIPFVDPCDATYTGDCICGSGSTTSVIINNIASQTPFTNPPVSPIEGDEFINTTDNIQWIYDGATWIVRPSGGSSDNLGNHTATQNLNLANFAITNENIPVHTSYATAFAALGAGRKFRYATANLEGVPSPNNSTLAFT